MRQGKDDMKVADGQNLLFSFFQPLLARHVLAFGTVPVSAGVIGNAQNAAVIAAFNAAAEIRRAAV
jgi:hypothetical protein